MKDIYSFINGIKFKRIVVLYIIAFLTALLTSGAVLGYAYREKLYFAYNYSNVKEKIEDGKLGVNSVKTDLTNLAKNSTDIVDILILDNHNNVTFSAKGSSFSQGSNFQLEQSNEDNSKYFTYTQDPNVTFKLITSDSLMISTVLLDRDIQIQNNYKDSTFFQDNTSAKKIYLLSYTLDKGTGDKIYFISDIHPVKNSQLLLNIVSAVLILFLMLYWVLVAFWVFTDSRKSKINPLLWGVIALCTNIAGLFIYLIYKQNSQICHQCGALQSKENIHCTHCGTKLNRTCMFCDSIVNEEDSYCSHCGSQIINKNGE